MSHPYLLDRSWADISREERLFCAELFHEVVGNETAFVAWLMGRPMMAGLGLTLEQDWEVGYEVCFYRDLLFSAGKSVRQSEFPDKRTFDLCLFSPTDIVIIEAKSQSAFDSKQNAEFEKDKERVLAAIEYAGADASNLRVHVIALASSRYFDAVAEQRSSGGLSAIFDGSFSWKELHESFSPRPLFLRADEVYRLTRTL